MNSSEEVKSENKSNQKLSRGSSLVERPLSPRPLSRKNSCIQNYTSIEDKFCNPNNPQTIVMTDVVSAAAAIEEGVMVTPCKKSVMSSSLGMELYFKKEFLQTTGSFKERGARYALKMLSEEQKKIGVIAASAGNHALALSYHGNNLGIPVTVIMPVIAPIMKIQACLLYNANVSIKGDDISESRMYALQIAKDSGLTYISGYDHPHILAGAGTMGLEIVDQVPDLDACIIPIGGGGLIAGCAVAMKFFVPTCKIYGVESECCASFTEALKHGKAVYTKPESTLADGLAVPIVGVNAFATASKIVDKVLTVNENFIALSILRLVEQEKAVVEGAGAVGLAAILQNLCPELLGKKVVVALCGGNIDTPALGRVLERGLAADGRLIKFVTTISDRPGGLAELTRLISSIGIRKFSGAIEHMKTIWFIDDTLLPQLFLLGLTFSTDLKCNDYIESIAATTARKVGSLYRAIFFSSESILHIYKSTIRLCIEYCFHIWSSAPAIDLEVLDKIQRRIYNLIDLDLASQLQSLSHRHDFASLCLFY